MDDELDSVKGAVERLHADLAVWMGSEAAVAVFERFSAAVDEGFSMVTISGDVVGRDELLTGLRGARNARPGLEIGISEVEDVARDAAGVVIRFLEEHRVGGTRTRRRVTAVLIRHDKCGYRWRSVHETTVPEGD